MEIQEAAPEGAVLEELIGLSRKWEQENSCWGYRENGPEDIQGRRVFVARENGKLIGYLFGKMALSRDAQSIMPEGTEYFFVEELYVRPDRRSQGIGGRLFRFAEEALRGETDYIRLGTATKNWKAILHFYLEEMGMTFWSAGLFKNISKKSEDEETV